MECPIFPPSSQTPPKLQTLLMIVELSYFQSLPHQKSSKRGTKTIHTYPLTYNQMNHNLITTSHSPHSSLLTLSWTLPPLPKPPSFRHHLALYHNKTDQINPLLTTYIQKLKNGDSFSLLYSNAELSFKSQNMREKLPKDSTAQNHYIRERAILSGHRERIMEKIEKDIQEGPTVVSIFLQHVGDCEWFVEKVRERRRTGKFQCPVALFAPFQHHTLDFHSGFHRLSTLTPPAELIPYFHSLINSSKLQHAELLISSPDAQLLCSTPETWNSPDFNQIQRNYLSLPSKYCQDTLHLQIPKEIPQFTLQLELNYKILGMEPQKQCWSMEIIAGEGKEVEGLPERGTGYADGKLELLGNPYESVSLLRIRPSMGATNEIA